LTVLHLLDMSQGAGLGVCVKPGAVPSGLVSSLTCLPGTYVPGY